MLGGIDEAGRGPIIGPMVVALVLVKDEKPLISLGVKDSKELSPGRRSKLASELIKIVDYYDYRIVEPKVIDEYVSRNLLNRLEAEVMANLIVKAMDKLNQGIVYIDSPDPIPNRFSKLLSELVGNHDIKIIALNKADKLIPTVSAASILAKVKRDEIIDELRRIYGDFGSGYPSDPRTINFLRNWIKTHGELPPIIRRSWSTLNRLLNDRLM